MISNSKNQYAAEKKTSNIINLKNRCDPLNPAGININVIHKNSIQFLDTKPTGLTLIKVCVVV